jgi:hypothetical protein
LQSMIVMRMQPRPPSVCPIRHRRLLALAPIAGAPA